MELKNAFILVMVCFCFLIGYGYAQAEVNVCNKHFYFDEEGNRHCDEIDSVGVDDYLSQSFENYLPGHNICFIDFNGPFFDKANPKMVCKPQNGLTKQDGQTLYANSLFAQLKEEPALEYFFLSYAATLDHPQANFNVAMVHYNGMFNQPKNKELAFQYMMTSAIEGYPKAMHNIGEMKLIGDGTEKDLITSFNWYKKASQYGLVESQFMVGKMYEMGWGVEQSNQQAFNNYSKAALLHDGEAMVRMASLINKDKSLGYDPVDSIILLYLAKHTNNHDAQSTFSEFVEQGIIDNQDIMNMDAWFKETCGKDNLGGCVADLQSNQLVRF
jgi:TPR repeat protein